MKITVEVSNKDAVLLGKWASVSRTLNEARRIMAESDLPNDDVVACDHEIRDLEPALNRLHQAVREEIWKTNAKDKANGN